jgi:hypothetical protein
MHEREETVERIERQNSKAELWRLLEDELDGAYGGELPTNQNTDFLRSCFSSTAPEDSPRECLERQFEGYSAEWEREKNEKHFLATALKCLLFERVGRSKDNTIGHPTKLYLAQLIVALRTADEGAIYSEDSNIRSAPSLDERPAHRFEPGFPFNQIDTSGLEEWVESQRSDQDGHHAVYVIDCTPETGEGEDRRVRGLRGRVHKKGISSDPRDKAAAAVNNGECIYYVGQTINVPKRMRQHSEGMTAGGAKFLSLFKPVEIVKLTWHKKKEIERLEKKRADELTEPGGPYAFCETSK